MSINIFLQVGADVIKVYLHLTAFVLLSFNFRFFENEECRSLRHNVTYLHKHPVNDRIAFRNNFMFHFH